MNVHRVVEASQKAAASLLDIVFPRVCPGCDRVLPSPRWLCSFCRRSFEPVGTNRVCFLCRQLHRGEGRRAGFDCSESSHANFWGEAGFWMGSPLDRIIHKLKYEGQANLAAGLSRALVGQVSPPNLQVSGILPIPLHRVRHRERGYNQSFLLAAGLQARWGVPVLEQVVLRSRPTAAQAKTPQEARAENMEGAFRVDKPKMAKSRSWILLDDVATTGSTLVEAARSLSASGASRSRLMVVALA